MQFYCEKSFLYRPIHLHFKASKTKAPRKKICTWVHFQTTYPFSHIPPETWFWGGEKNVTSTFSPQTNFFPTSYRFIFLLPRGIAHIRATSCLANPVQVLYLARSSPMLRDQDTPYMYDTSSRRGDCSIAKNVGPCRLLFCAYLNFLTLLFATSSREEQLK